MNRAIDEGEYKIYILLDLSEAIYTSSRNIFLEKLKYFGVDNVALF